MEMLLSGGDRDSERLRLQIDSARVDSRDYTGVGVFVEFAIPDELAIPAKERRVISNLGGEMDGLKNGFGGVLFLENGKIKVLEFFTYDEEWPKEAMRYSLSLFRNSTDA
jgi:hypothetical protein